MCEGRWIRPARDRGRDSSDRRPQSRCAWRDWQTIAFTASDTFEQLPRSANIMDVTRCQYKSDRIDRGVGERMDFACQTAPGASDGLVLAPFFRAPGAMLMGADDRGVDHQVLSVRVAPQRPRRCEAHVITKRRRGACAAFGRNQEAGDRQLGSAEVLWLRHRNMPGDIDKVVKTR